MTTYSWSAVGTSGTWGTASNWAGGVVPTGGNSAYLGAAESKTGKAYTVTISAGNSYSVSTLTLQSAGPSGRSTPEYPQLQINGTLTITGQLIYTALAGSGQIATPITIGSGGTLDLATTTAASVTGPAETITVGGTLELASFMNYGVAFAYSGTGALIQYDAYTSGTTLSQTVTGFGKGDALAFAGDTLKSVTYSGTTLTVTDSSNQTFTLSNFSLASGDSGSNLQISGDEVIYATCFASGTRIGAPGADILVDDMRAGDRVLVLQGAQWLAREVRWVGHRHIDLITHPKPHLVAPVRIRAGAFGGGLPVRDLVVSPDHALFVDGVLIAARQLINGTSIAQESGWSAVDYYHIELDRHGILLAEGLPAESYLDTGNRGFFANSGLPLTLHPDLTEDRTRLAREAGACAPFVTDEAAVEPIWQRLAGYAAALGLAAPAMETTSDPALRLVAKGRTVKPVFNEQGLCIFPLPLGATGARIVSRTASPATAQPWLDDRRKLGVAIRRIVLRTAGDVIELPVDAPELGEGWWAVERAGEAMFRWTNGSALLAFPPLKGHAMLELHIQGSMDYAVEAESAPTLPRAANVA